MASSFDGVGLGSMGFEKQFMTGDNPLREALKGLKTGMIVRGIQSSGIPAMLNPQASGAPVIPPAPVEQNNASAMVPPPMQNTLPPLNESPNLGDELNKEWGLESSTTFTSPNTFAASPSATDTSMLAMASQPAPPPGNLNLPQYGKKDGGGGLDIAMKILPMLFGIPA
jgi:hypothetical protein